MTQSEYLRFVRLTMPQLFNLVQSMGYEQVMIMKNDLQRAMATYSKGKQGRFDSIQEKSLAIMIKLEKWMKLAFMEREMRKLDKNYPNLTAAGRKAMAREAWEDYNRKMSY